MHKNILSKDVEYKIHNKVHKGFLAQPKQYCSNTKTILIAHDWSGRNDFFCEKAIELAGLGYIAFAIDLYGNAQVGNTIEEKQKLYSPLVNDRKELLLRMQKSLEVLHNIPIVNVEKISAMGYCFGGLSVLDLARSGATLQGIISFHGILTPPPNIICAKIKAKILVLHGYKDPMVSPKDVQSFEKEMCHKNVDWQVHVYGQAHHAFTNPKAHDTSLGLVYNETAKNRSWESAMRFLESL